MSNASNTDNDNPHLPAITLVESGAEISQFWRIIVDAQHYRPSAVNGAEIEAIHTSLQGALDDATQYLYNFAANNYAHPTGHTLIDLPRDRPTRTSQKRIIYEIAISLSQQAWDNFRTQTKRLHYDGNGGDLNSVGGVNNYLRHLLAANPTPDDWTDTRPDWLTEEDAPRLASDPPKFPMWSLYDSREDYRRGRLLNRANWDTNLQPPLLAISHRFLISSALKERSRASAALEAIGLEYLSPTHPCPQNPHPPKKYYGIFDRHRSRRQSSLQQQFELTF
jgi:hypothetical protein